MKITVIGCGRWGSLITWYLDKIGQEVTLYGRESSDNMQRFIKERKNDLLELPETITLSTDLSCERGRSHCNFNWSTRITQTDG